MNVEFINPFIQASQSVLFQLGLESKLGKIFLKSSPYGSDNVTILVGMTGKMRGQTVLSMKVEVAQYIASTMMGGVPVNELDAMAKSAISELANMILGNTATILYEKGVGIEISPPSIIIGEKIQISSTNTKTMCIPLMLPNGEEFQIDVTLAEG